VPSVLFKNAALLDPPQVELREGYDVLVDDVMIKEVSDRPLETSADRTIDRGDRTLMPGLIDLHAHAVAVELNLAQRVRMPNVLVRLRSTLICAACCDAASRPSSAGALEQPGPFTSTRANAPLGTSLPPQ
jgi:predicted amidohydrolase YtcJ